MLKFNKSILFLLVFSTSFLLHAQEEHHHLSTHEKHHESKDAHEEKGHFRIGTALAHTYIGTATATGKETIIVPTIILDLEYWFKHHQLGLGFHNDIELESFIIENQGEEAVEKEFPVLVTLDVLWRPWKGLVLLGGYGFEFVESESIPVGRLGVEYEIDLAPGWDVFPSVVFDTRKDQYNTWAVGFGIGRHF